MASQNRKRHPSTYLVTMEEIQKYVARGRKEALDGCVVVLFGLTYLCLRDEFHFGKTRILRAMNRLSNLIEALGKGEFTMGDVKDELKREIGVDISDSKIFVPFEAPKKTK